MEPNLLIVIALAIISLLAVGFLIGYLVGNMEFNQAIKILENDNNNHKKSKDEKTNPTTKL